MKLYEEFEGEELKIAEKIQQRRLQILVHSYIYYELDQNIISDQKWMEWTQELALLQIKYPILAKKVLYAETFDKFDGSTGVGLCYMTPDIIALAERLLKLSEKKNVSEVKKEKPKLATRKLF